MPHKCRPPVLARSDPVLNVKDRLARIDGVGQVQVFGAGDYSMRVWLDPQKIAQLGLSASDVVNEIRAQNVQAAAGVIGASPGLPNIDLQLPVNAQGRLQSEQEFGDIIVKTGDKGEVTRLRDVAPSSSARPSICCSQQAGGGDRSWARLNAIAISDNMQGDGGLKVHAGGHQL
jgi:hypothetical protein